MLVLDLCEEPDVDMVPIVTHLRSGGLVAYPTETVYGIGGVCSIEASMRVRELKDREETKPLIALVPNRESVVELEWTPEAVELAETFWPGSLTLVLRDPNGLFPDGVRDSDRKTVAVRESPHSLVSHLVRNLGQPLTSTSLNRSGEPAITTGAAAREFLVSLDVKDVWLIDGGSLPPSLPSTIVDCTTAPPSVLREGAIPAERLRRIIEEADGSVE